MLHISSEMGPQQWQFGTIFESKPSYQAFNLNNTIRENTFQNTTASFAYMIKCIKYIV